MNRARIVIAGTHSGSGKTTVTLGVMAALRRRGLRVQGFKVGPDYIDPSYHTAVTGRPSRNLDTWMMSVEAIRELFDRGSEGVDIAVIEGVMGLYDGIEPLSNRGSTAEMSRLFEAPVVLVVDVASMARSVAAVVLGFQSLDPRVNIAGIIANRVGSKGHFELVQAAVEQVCGIPTLGYLTKQDSLHLPERHLGLIPALERGELFGLFDTLAKTIPGTVDLERILQLAQSAPAWITPTPILFVDSHRKTSMATIAIARDSAFNFYYPENLELLEWYGAHLVEFRPLDGDPIPNDADGVYIGGGFPEEFAAILSQREDVKSSLRQAVEDGMPVFAECGGLMYLSEVLTNKEGESYPMAGVIAATVSMQSHVAALGYREVTARQDTLLLSEGERARGHEFHYSTITYPPSENWPYAYEAIGMRGSKLEGYAQGNVLAGYTHLHFASNPNMAQRFIRACRAYRQRQPNRA